MFKSLQDKIMNMTYLLHLNKRGNVGNEMGTSSSRNGVFFRVRRSNFSLESWAIRPSVVFGTRRRTALHGGGFAWVPDLGSFFKLLEVGVSPYLGFTLYLSVLQCFGLVEALNGRLIGSKAWNRDVGF